VEQPGSEGRHAGVLTLWEERVQYEKLRKERPNFLPFEARQAVQRTLLAVQSMEMLKKTTARRHHDPSFSDRHCLHSGRVRHPEFH
jgi:hypothetical protein